MSPTSQRLKRRPINFDIVASVMNNDGHAFFS